MAPKTRFVLLLPFLFLQCTEHGGRSLSPAQQLVADHLDNAGRLSRLIGSADTIRLQVPDTAVVDVFPRVLASSSGFVLCNPMGRTIVSVDRSGRFVRSFGRPGTGPGEFRSIVAACLDTLENIYLVDNLLARLTVFRPDGSLLSTLSLKNPFLVRHICATDPGRVLLHHAPDSSGGWFVTVLADSGKRQGLLAAPPGFEAYYYRGHLEGGILVSPSGTVFETNAYAPVIRIIRGDGSVGESERGDRTFTPLPPATEFRAIQELQDAVSRSTTVRGLYLAGASGYLLQELLSFSGSGLSVERTFGIFDTTGAYLGSVDCDVSGIQASEGDNLLQVLNPLPPRGSYRRTGEIRLPSIVILHLQLTDHG